jgi:hypothetical protein
VRTISQEDSPERCWLILPQALEGKDVKDLLMNVGSGGGAAAVASSGAPAAGGAAAPEEAKEEEKKEEGEYSDLFLGQLITPANTSPQRRKSQTKIWVSDFSTRRLPLLFVCTYNAWLGLSSLGAIFAWTSCFHRMSKLI